METILLFDSNSFIHRAFHAIKANLSSKEGRPTNAVYGFFSMILNLINEYKPDFTIFAFDSKEKTFRHEMFTEYKGTRVKAPDSLYDQIPIIIEGLENLNAFFLNSPGYEGDDIIGSLARKAENENLNVMIATSDLDSMQIVNKNTRIICASQGIQKICIYDEAKVFERFEVHPCQIPDYKAICGDKSDNIPGIFGVGPKKASMLLQKYNNLENIYKNLDNLDNKTKLAFSENQQTAFLSKELATIKMDMDLKIDFDKSAIKNFDLKNLKNFFDKYDCQTLIKKLNFLEQNQNNKKNLSQPTLF